MVGEECCVNLKRRGGGGYGGDGVMNLCVEGVISWKILRCYLAKAVPATSLDTRLPTSPSFLCPRS